MQYANPIPAGNAGITPIAQSDAAQLREQPAERTVLEILANLRPTCSPAIYILPLEYVRKFTAALARIEYAHVECRPELLAAMRHTRDSGVLVTVRSAIDPLGREPIGDPNFAYIFALTDYGHWWHNLISDLQALARPLPAPFYAINLEASVSNFSDLLTPVEAAKHLRIGRTSVYKLMRSRELGSLTIGGKRFVTYEMVERYKAMRIRASLPPGVKR